MRMLTKAEKTRYVALLFAAAIVLLVVAVLTHSSAPLFVAWAPLLAVAWVLARPEPGDPLVQADEVGRRRRAVPTQEDDDDWDEEEQDEASA